jgi:hypothetical protein
MAMSEATCRIVGISPKTGRRWRNGSSADRKRKAAPPITGVGPPSGPSHYLREADRIQIADQLRERATVRVTAVELSRSPSSVSREPVPGQRPGPPLRRPRVQSGAARVRPSLRRPTPRP